MQSPCLSFQPFPTPHHRHREELPKVNLELYTWGSPRVGNLALKEALADVPMFRFLGVNDPVPHIPWLSGFYQHCSAGIYLFPAEGGKCEW